jgi:hypothetical protein
MRPLKEPIGVNAVEKPLQTRSSKLLRILSLFLASIAGTLLFAFFLETVYVTPDHANVYIDFENSGLYLSPRCAVSKYGETMTHEGLLMTTRGKARKNLEARPHPDCVEASGFTQASSIGRWLLSECGIWPLASRWNSDGSWNW